MQPERPSRLPLHPLIGRALGEAWADTRLSWQAATTTVQRAAIAGAHLAGLLRILGRAVAMDLDSSGVWRPVCAVLLPSIAAGVVALPSMAASELAGFTGAAAPVAAYVVALGSWPRRPTLFVLLVAGALPGCAGILALEGVRAVPVVPFLIGSTAGLILIADRALLDARRWAACLLAPLLPLAATALYAKAAMALTPDAPGGRTVSVGWFLLLSLVATWWLLVRRSEHRWLDVEKEKASAALARH